MRFKKIVPLFTALVIWSITPTRAVAAEIPIETLFTADISGAFATNDPYIIDKQSGLIYLKNNENTIFAGGIAVDGRIYNESGAQENTLSYIGNKYSEQYDNAKQNTFLEFDSLAELNIFINWMQLEYSDHQGVPFIYHYNSDGSCQIRKSEVEKLLTTHGGDISPVLTELSSQIPPHYTLEEKADMANILVARYLTYDSEYESASMERALQDKKGVCYHYAKLLKGVLNDCGIQAEYMIGDFEGVGMHCWLRIYDSENNRYMYRDAAKTNADLANGLFTVHLYDVYVRSYQIIGIAE